MRLFIRHETTYRYETAPRSVIEELRLTPCDSSGQSINNWQIEVSTDVRLSRGNDAFGNVIHTFSMERPGSELSIVATGVVDTSPTNGVVAGTREPLRHDVFLRRTERTSETAPIAALADTAQLKSDGTVLDLAHKLNAAVHEAMEFEPQVVDNGLTADAALSAGSGASQDFAHVMLAAARHLSVPARYVAGYRYLTERAGPQGGHGWTELMIPELGWVSFDPSSAVSPDESYVRVAIGLDALNAAPVRGAALGGAGESLDVAVWVDNQAGGPSVGQWQQHGLQGQGFPNPSARHRPMM